jgi:hypothetical protein
LVLIFRLGQWSCALLFCQERPPVCTLLIVPTTSPFNYRTFMSGNLWHYVDAHFQNAAGSLILVFLIWKAANTLFMNGCNQSALRLPRMHSQKLLMLRWRSFSEGGQWSCCLLFCQERLSVCTLWIVLTMSPCNYRTYMTENHRPTVDAHFNLQWSQDLLPILIAILNIWTLWMPFNMVRTWLYGKAEPSNNPAVVALIQLKFICYAKWCILPATGLFVNEYSLATRQHSSLVIF